MSKGCGCKKWNGKACSEQFSIDYVKQLRVNIRELTTSELDLVIMGQLMANSNTSDTTSIDQRHKSTERKKPYTCHLHQSKVICQVMFMFFHGIGTKRLKNIVHSVKVHGITPRTHGNKKRLPKNALSMKSMENVVRFLLNYVEQHGLLLPGRIPGYSRDDIKLLPSSVSKKGIWSTYFQAAQQDPEVHAVAYTTFCHLWRQLLPSIRLMKPMTDLCWTCQKNSTAILRSANFPDKEKSATIKNAQEHLQIVQIERSYYKTKCDDCRRDIISHFSSGDEFQPPPLASHTPANSRDITAHYSFDYAQQVHYPSDPMQPGPIYFLTPRKCAVFGVNCEAIPRQVNFLSDEAGVCGKGANTVISQLHYFFDHHGLGEKEVFLHADNCTGQNKNNCMLHYLAWRVMTGRHTQITLSFLVVGHTKFSPDWCFGLFKRLYRRSMVGSLQSVAKVVNDSAKCNFAQLITAEDGSIVVPTFDWTDFLAPHYKKFSNIKKYHHFRFVSSEPGVVFAKEHADTTEERVELLKGAWSPVPSNYPPQLYPKGLSAGRQWYKPTSRAGTPVAVLALHHLP